MEPTNQGIYWFIFVFCTGAASLLLIANMALRDWREDRQANADMAEAHGILARVMAKMAELDEISVRLHRKLKDAGH